MGGGFSTSGNFTLTGGIVSETVVSIFGGGGAGSGAAVGLGAGGGTAGSASWCFFQKQLVEEKASRIVNAKKTRVEIIGPHFPNLQEATETGTLSLFQPGL